MPRANRCEEWEALGLPCPYALLDAVRERKKERDKEVVPTPHGKKRAAKQEEVPIDISSSVPAEKKSDPFFFFGERNKKIPRGQIVSMEEWEALLLEIARRSSAKQINMPEEVPVPQEIVQEAIRQGARGRALSLWVAAVAAVLAVAAAGGGNMALQIPQTLRAIASAQGSVRTGGTLFNSAAQLEFALSEIDRELIGGGAGDFFPGILG